jgi:hypothetical protein
MSWALFPIGEKPAVYVREEVVQMSHCAQELQGDPGFGDSLVAHVFAVRPATRLAHIW